MSNRSVKFSAIGDVTLGDHPLCVGFGAYSRFRKEDALFPFLKSLEALRRSELLFGNLECAHSRVGLREGDYNSIQMRGDPRHIEALVAAGFSVVNVANNHSMQHGNDAFLDTVRQLEHSNIACCGVAADATATSARPAIVRKNGLAVGFLGYSLRPRQYFEHVPLYAEGEPEAMVRDVQALRKQADAVIVSLHWGEEFIQRPSPGEIGIARRLVDAGADLVIGHHPHVLRGIERHGRGCIVYSLGNFVCDMVWDDTLRTSLIFECTLTGDGVRDINLVPTYTNDDFQPEVLTGDRAQAVLDQLQHLASGIDQPQVITNQAAASERYMLDADAVHRHIRAKSHRFFLTRFWKYPAPILIQQLGTYVRNRLHERFVAN
jgi:poly-gamma-glutamate synthesis protein (capsule biosynthesis protein)